MTIRASSGLVLSLAAVPILGPTTAHGQEFRQFGGAITVGTSPTDLLLMNPVLLIVANQGSDDLSLIFKAWRQDQQIQTLQFAGGPTALGFFHVDTCNAFTVAPSEGLMRIMVSDGNGSFEMMKVGQDGSNWGFGPGLLRGHQLEEYAAGAEGGGLVLDQKAENGGGDGCDGPPAGKNIDQLAGLPIASAAGYAELIFGFPFIAVAIQGQNAIELRLYNGIGGQSQIDWARRPNGDVPSIAIEAPAAALVAAPLLNEFLNSELAVLMPQPAKVVILKPIPGADPFVEDSILFEPAGEFAVRSDALFLSAGDADGDGDNDIAVGSGATEGRIDVYLNQGGGSFTHAAAFSTGPDGRAAVVGDININGTPDIAVISGADDTVTLFEQATFDDCNGNGIADSLDLLTETSQDCNGNDIPDECEFKPVPVGAGANANAQCGVRIDFDGVHAAAGAWGTKVGNFSNAGAVQVFDADDWTQDDPIPNPTPAQNDRFGSDVSLSGDRLLIGAFHDKGATDDSGSAFVYKLSGGSWTLEQLLTDPKGAAADEFGTAVSLDGDVAAVGARFSRLDGNGPKVGSVEVFTRSGDTWVHKQRLTPPNPEAGMRFGHSVTVAGDRILVGAPFATVGGHAQQGAAYIYRRDQNTWVLEAKLTVVNGAPFDQFGFAADFDGSRAAIAAPDATLDAGPEQGAVYIFERFGNAWLEVAGPIVAADASSYDSFGSGVSLDGDRLAVGARLNDELLLDAGSAYLFDRDGDAWVQSAKLVSDPNAEGDQFGHRVALRGDELFVSATFADAGGSSSGRVYAFPLPPACRPDIDGNGALNLFDFLDFVNRFNAGDPKADFDCNKVLNLFDFLTFVNVFNTGC